MNKEETIKKVADFINSDGKIATKIVEKAVAGGETEGEDFSEWYEKRFVPNVVFVSQEEYSRMCISALKIVRKTAPTDYGQSRQRDLGQLWADVTRGYIGEAAFAKFLKSNWGIEAKLGHEQGELEEYLPADVHEVKKPSDQGFRSPGKNISVKAVKMNAIWLDIPGAQFGHSDVQVLVKTGAGRDHLFAYFKLISVFKDKVLKKGVSSGFLSEAEADELFDELPSFEPIPAYIAGFVDGEKNYPELSYSGRMGIKHFTVDKWAGPISPGDLERIKEREDVDSEVGKVKFEGIGQFSHDAGYLFNTGSLEWKRKDWEDLINEL